MKLKIGFGNREEDKELNELVEVFMKMNTKQKMENLLEGILTPKELVEFYNRLEIVRMLKRGVTQHDIAGKLRVGVATVGRGSREIQRGRFENI